jgi:hypothetical protein
MFNAQWAKPFQERLNLDLHEDKIRLWNHLCENLDLVVQMFAQLFYIVDTFQCHHNLDKGESQEGSSSLLAFG